MTIHLAVPPWPTDRVAEARAVIADVAHRVSHPARLRVLVQHGETSAERTGRNACWWSSTRGGRCGAPSAKIREGCAMMRRGTPEADLPARRRAGAAHRPAPQRHHPSLRQRGDRGRAAGKRQAIPVGMGVHAGFADLMVICDGRVLFLELKAPKGRLRPEQEASAMPFWRRVRLGAGAQSRRRAGRAGRSRLHHAHRPCPAEARAMSHEATNWAIKQRGLKPTTKIVLWHLCDRFNPTTAASPRRTGWRMTARSAGPR
jgi:hypothetical protein